MKISTVVSKSMACFISTLLMSHGYADGLDEPIPSFYQEPGVSRTRDYISQHVNERIDPFTGKLQYHFVDLYIPGNAGLDIKVERSYNSLNEWLEDESSPAGLGWTMHFGRVLRRATNNICTNNNGPLTNPVLEMPDGSRRVLYLAPDNMSWITTDFWKAECNTSSGALGLNVFSPNGVRYEMKAYGHMVGSGVNTQNTYYVSRITDRNGNWLHINYDFLPNGIYAVKSVTSNDGRAAIFSYNGTALASVKDGTTDSNGNVVAGNRTWTYTQVAASLDSKFLTEVKRPDGYSWKFDYNPTSTETPGRYSMRRITYPVDGTSDYNPAGGTIDYTYDFVNFAFNTSIPRSTVVKKKVANPGGTWTWSYTPARQKIDPNDDGGFSFSIPPDANEAIRYDRTTVTGPDESRTYYHVGYESAYSGITYMIGSLLGVASDYQVEQYGSSPIIISDQANVRPGNELVFDGVTAARLITAHFIGRFGESFYTTYDNFDAYGNPQTITEEGSNTRTTNINYYNDPDKYIIGQKMDETVTDGDETLATTRSFDANGNLLSMTRAGVTTSYTYTSEGDIASRTDARNKTTSYSDYYRGIPRTESHPEGITITRSVSNAGNVTSETDGEEATTSFSYDEINRITGITHPIGNPVVVQWGLNSRTVTRGAYQGVTTYDGFGREVAVEHTDTSRGESIRQTYQLDSLGRKVFASYRNSTIGTKLEYDMLGRNTAAYNEYNPTNGNWTSKVSKDHFDYGVQVVNENDYVYFYQNRSYGDPDKTELVSIQTPQDIDGPSTIITRNINGQMMSVTQDGVTRTYGYDSHFFLTSMTEPETGVTVMERDEVGNMISRQVGTASPTTYTYDDRNRLTKITYPTGTPSVSKTYFKDDKLKSIDNGIANRTYAYDANKNLIRESLTVGSKVFPITYGYDGNDARASIQYGSTKTVSYVPDAFGRPRQAAPYVTSVSYHPTGQPSSFAYANGVQTTIGLNGRQWPSSLVVTKGGNLFNTAYSYDPMGNVTAISDSVDTSYNRTMSYDPIDRLTGVNGPWGNGSISYDLRGNILSQSFGTFGLTYSYDTTTQRLSSVSGSRAYALQYDIYGNVVGNGTTTFSYNDASAMQCARCGQADEALYDYDGANQRVWSRKNGTETFFVYGNGGELLWEETPHVNLKEYVYLLGKQVAIREQVLP